ncbi:MAG: hypothetical protein QY331_07725 [Melioribacteraceae bacterium]|nr:MAG: hypothetical protein QY331_07725 [Melioribacteraceae bacterium]
MKLSLFKYDLEIEAAEKRRELQSLFTDDELDSIAQVFDYQYNRCFWELRSLNSKHWLPDEVLKRKRYSISKQRSYCKTYRDKFRNAKRR